MGHIRDLMRSNPPFFDGKGTGLEVETWLISLDRCFIMYPYGRNTKARCAIMRLKSFASIWWWLEEERISVSINTLSWEIFLERFKARFLSPQWRQSRADELYALHQFGISVDQFEHMFYELKQYADIGNDEVMLVQHFLRGLNDRISGRVRVFELALIEVAVAKARLVEQNLVRAHGGVLRHLLRVDNNSSNRRDRNSFRASRVATLSIGRTGTGRGADRVSHGSPLRVHLRPLVGEASNSPVG
ncbi:uncharacterized protein LOC131030994 [Cryptomeria japonica]|uniref:uncharacterized protein LOC131030994 n=1 Tax=Cryptomeria japonica TaxID=3369 RepID=UPI0025AB71DF|nr:uncharacterized protein LOC131030994 [Cryptomeria japonica]